MNQESRKGGTRCPQRVITGPSHRLGDKPIHLPTFLIDLYV
jgi:hypothetical protein